MTEHNIQCFFASQNKNFEIERTEEEETGSYKAAHITSHV